MSEKISRTTVEENDANIIKSQVMNVLDDKLIRHQVRGLDQPAPEPPVLETLNVTENGTYTPEEGVDGFDEVNVDVELHGDTAYDLKYAPSGSISTFTDGVDLPLNKLVVGIEDDTNRSYFQGLLNGTYGFVDIGTLSWSYNSTLAVFSITNNALNNLKEKAYIICENYICSNSKNYTQLENLEITSNGAGFYSEGVPCLILKNTLYTDAQTFKQAMNGVYLIYELETPTTPTITDAEYQLLLNAFGVGVSECNLVVNGINQWDEEWVQGHVSTTTGELIETGQKIRSKNYIPVIPNASYYCIPANGTNGLNYACYDIDKNFIIGGEIIESVNFSITIPPRGKYIMISTFGTTISTYNNDISINYPSTDTSYHAYDGHTYNIPFPSGVTISNGSIDILNGVLTDDDLSETYNITPIAIRSLEGVNNVFADTGDVEELEYFYDVTTEIKDEVIAFLDFNENYTESRDVFYDKINGTPSVQSHRSITYDSDGNMIFDNTNGYLWIAQYLGFNKAYKIEVDIVGKTSYIADDGTNIFKFNLGNNHVICTWDASNSNWKMQDWTGHDTRLNEDFDFFNGKKLDIFFNASYVNGVLTKNANNTLTMYVGDTLVYSWEQSASLTGDDNIACIGLGHNSACKNFAFKSVKITKLNNLEV